MTSVELVSIAASGNPDRGLNTERLVKNVDTPAASYEPEFDGSFVRFEEGASELFVVYTIGKDIVRQGHTRPSTGRIGAVLAGPCAIISKNAIIDHYIYYVPM